jgi:pimeloyl-ACP methyl ester carboxylesterase
MQSMKAFHRIVFFLVFLVFLTAATSLAAPAQAPAGSALRVTLPFDLVDTLDGAKFKIRVPANWNGTLLVHLQGGKNAAAPPEPALVPRALPGSEPALEETLLSRGYALAASEIADTDLQVKESVQDHFALTTYFRGRIGDPTRVILWGTSNGGLASLRLIEDFPRSFNAAIAACAPDAGMPRRWDRFLDFALAYAAVFGWQEDAWGPLEGELRPDLNFQTQVYPTVNWPAADGSNRGGWEFIRLVNRLASDAFWKPDPAQGGYPGLLENLLQATQGRANNEMWASGRFMQNLDHAYSLTPDEKAYLAGLGVKADDLLAKMNARTNIAANPRARDFIDRFGNVRGVLKRPVVILHTTLDGLNEVASESAYRRTVEASGYLDNLVQVYVAGVGHGAFTTKQYLAALAAVESWLDSGMRPDAAAFPEALGFDNAFAPPPWPY